VKGNGWPIRDERRQRGAGIAGGVNLVADFEENMLIELIAKVGLRARVFKGGDYTASMSLATRSSRPAAADLYWLTSSRHIITALVYRARGGNA
jgi:hypothetical protein